MHIRYVLSTLRLLRSGSGYSRSLHTINTTHLDQGCVWPTRPKHEAATRFLSWHVKFKFISINPLLAYPDSFTIFASTSRGCSLLHALYSPHPPAVFSLFPSVEPRTRFLLNEHEPRRYLLGLWYVKFYYQCLPTTCFFVENCAPPAGTPGYVVAERLRATCGAYGSVTQFRAYLELSATQSSGPSQPSHSASADPSLNDHPCPSTSPKTLTLRSELQSSGVSLIDCPHNSRKNVADSMLACDLVCFALDNPAVPQIPYPSHIPTSPYSIPCTPFSAVTPPTMSFSKTTIVLISGDRDFAYPLAVLKARKYEVGLIVPPGGAHPALRAQASWVMNWKDVLEGTNSGQEGKCEPVTGATGASVDVQTNAPSTPGQGARRGSFASRRGSVSSPRRGSMSTSPTPAPPPPPIAIESIPNASISARRMTPAPDSLDLASVATVRGPSGSSITIPPPPEGSTSQLPASKASRKPSVRRAAKAASRPPSRTKTRGGPKSNKLERAEEVAKTAKSEQSRPQPIIVPVPLTASPVGAAGPSFAGMSPRVSCYSDHFLNAILTRIYLECTAPDSTSIFDESNDPSSTCSSPSLTASYPADQEPHSPRQVAYSTPAYSPTTDPARIYSPSSCPWGPDCSFDDQSYLRRAISGGFCVGYGTPRPCPYGQHVGSTIAAPRRNRIAPGHSYKPRSSRIGCSPQYPSFQYKHPHAGYARNATCVPAPQGLGATPASSRRH